MRRRLSISFIGSVAPPDVEEAAAQGDSLDPVPAAHDRLGHAPARGLAQGLLAPWAVRAQHVEAHPADGRGEPPAQVLDAVGVRAAEPEPGFLDGAGFAA